MPGAAGLRRAIRGPVRRWHPCSPAWRNNRATHLREYATPASRTSARIRGAPYEPRLCSWISRIRWLRRWSARARAQVGRKSYSYSVTSGGFVTEHYVLDGGSLTMLPLPNWSDEGYLPREDGRHGRSVTVSEASR